MCFLIYMFVLQSFYRLGNAPKKYIAKFYMKVGEVNESTI